MNLTSNTTSQKDVEEIIDTIIEDNKFSKATLMKECNIGNNTKKLKLEHLNTICKVKGYKLTVNQPEDVIKVEYHLVNQDMEPEEGPLNDFPEIDTNEKAPEDKPNGAIGDLDFL